MSHGQSRACRIARRRRAVAACVVAGAITAVAAPALAQELGEPRKIDDASGPGASARPSPYFPSRGDTGVAIDASATYGIPVSPFVIAPGARFAAYFGDMGAVSGMPVVEVMLPIGELVPYAKAGAGIGHATGPRDTSAAIMVGGGLDVHLTRDVLLGVDTTWETIPGTGFNAMSIGPRVGLRY